MFTPADRDADRETFEWDRPGASWCDARLRAFVAATAASPPRVVSVSADELGGFRLSLAGGFAFEVFPNSSHVEHDETEFWRLLQPGTAAPHVVVGSAGMDQVGDV